MIQNAALVRDRRLHSVDENQPKMAKKAPGLKSYNNNNNDNNKKHIAAVCRKGSVNCPKHIDNNSNTKSDKNGAVGKLLVSKAKESSLKSLAKPAFIQNASENGVDRDVSKAEATHGYNLRSKCQKLAVLNGVAVCNCNDQRVVGSKTGITAELEKRFKRKADLKKMANKKENSKTLTSVNEEDKENIGRNRINSRADSGEKCIERPRVIVESEKADDRGQTEEFTDEVTPQPITTNMLAMESRNEDMYGFEEYAEDIVQYCFSLEEKRKLPEKFLNINSKARGVLVDWLIQVADCLGLLQETLELCINMADRYVAGNRVKLDVYQLLGLTCLLVSSKYEERFAPEIESLLFLTQDLYTFEQVLEQECLILQGLDYQVASPVPSHYVPSLVKALKEKKNKNVELGEEFYKKVENMAKYFLVLIATDASFAVVPASVRATAAISLAFEILSEDVDRCRDCKALFSRVSIFRGTSSSAVKGCIVALAKFVSKAPTAVHQGARVMFSTTEFGNVSHSNALSESVTLGWLSSQ